MKVAASSSELGPTRAPRIKAGRLDDDDNHDDEERGTQNGKDTRFPRLCFPRKKPTTFFRPSPLLSSERIRSKNLSFDSTSVRGKMNGKREERKEKGETRRCSGLSTWKTEETAVAQPRKRTCRRVATSLLDVILPAVLG